MNMNKKIPQEVYVAFAHTKPTEFDSFLRDWLQNNQAPPESIEIVEATPKPKKATKPKKPKTATPTEPENSETLEATEDAVEETPKEE
jgi:hypothetical protein